MSNAIALIDYSLGRGYEAAWELGNGKRLFMYTKRYQVGSVATCQNYFLYPTFLILWGELFLAKRKSLRVQLYISVILFHVYSYVKVILQHHFDFHFFYFPLNITSAFCHFNFDLGACCAHSRLGRSLSYHVYSTEPSRFPLLPNVKAISPEQLSYDFSTLKTVLKSLVGRHSFIAGPDVPSPSMQCPSSNDTAHNITHSEYLKRFVLPHSTSLLVQANLKSAYYYHIQKFALLRLI